MDATFMTIEEVAHLLRLDRRTLQNRRSAGLAPHGFREGRRVLYRRSEVERYMAEREAAEGGGAA